MPPFFENTAMIPSLLTGLATALFVWSIAKMFGRRPDIPPGASAFEPRRRKELEAKNIVYKYLQPLVLELAQLNSWLGTTSPRKFRHSRTLGVVDGNWEPFEFVAVKQIEGAIAGLFVAGIFSFILPLALCAILVVIVAAAYSWMAVNSCHQKAIQKVQRLKMRLPFSIDLMALMIEAGATFREALQTVVRENRGHPLGDELEQVERELRLGRPRDAALSALSERVNLPSVAEFVFAVNMSGKLGTSIASTLRIQADQMRLKRSQWGEKAAAEAQVQISFPGFVVMIACMFVVLGPIILPAVFGYLES